MWYWLRRQKAAESVIEAFMWFEANIMVQEDIKEAGGADIFRCFVIGDKVIVSMKTPSTGDGVSL